MTSDEATTQPGGLPLPIDGETRVYAILGDPIEQVGSPRVFNTLFREKGRKAVLVPFHVAPDALEAGIAGLRAMQNLDGIIVTVPHKASVMAYVDVLGDNAGRVGAVNAIRRESDGRLLGENFDGKGCVIGLERQGHELSGRRALVIGAGGAGAAVAHALADAGVSAMTVHDIDAGRCEKLVDSLNASRPDLAAQSGPAEPGGCDLVINCSPLGMKESDPMPVEPGSLEPGSLVVDVILKPRISRFLEAAEVRGCRIQPGYRMLEGQADAVAGFFGMAT